MRDIKRFFAFSVVALIIGAASAADPIRPDQFEPLKELIKPSAGEEPWATIPWRIDLTSARQEAAREGKPILLWEMDGHPLGCT